LLLTPFKEQTFDLTLCVVGQFERPVLGNVLLDHSIRLSLTGFDMNAQQSR
jgi:hypothetical protein